MVVRSSIQSYSLRISDFAQNYIWMVMVVTPHVMTLYKPAQVILMEKLTMSMKMEDDIKRRTAKRKAALVM
jgi:hypothetical protein